MLPQDLKAEFFAGYPPEARKIVTNYLGTLRQLTLSFVPGLLRELIEYDFKFPAERNAHERELEHLDSLSGAQLKEWFEGFAGIRLSPQLEAFDWIKAPAQFMEQLSAHLGARINWTHSVRPQTIMRIDCVLLSRRNGLKSQGLELPSSAKV